MNGDKIFQMLVNYHIEVNLPRCLPFIQDGRVTDPVDHEPFEAPSGENSLYKGILIVSNGPTLVDNLIEQGLAKGEDLSSFVPLPDADAFRSYLQERVKEDGAHLYDSANRRIARVYELNNQHDSLEGCLDLNRVPADFVYDDARGVSGADLGTRTRIAMRLPAIPELQTLNVFQIKQTGYGDLGFGKVTYFNKDGLQKEFFCQYNAEQDSIDGVLREYELREGQLSLVSEKIEPVCSLKLSESCSSQYKQLNPEQIAA